MHLECYLSSLKWLNVLNVYIIHVYISHYLFEWYVMMNSNCTAGQVNYCFGRFGRVVRFCLFTSLFKLVVIFIALATCQAHKQCDKSDIKSDHWLFLCRWCDNYYQRPLVTIGARFQVLSNFCMTISTILFCNILIQSHFIIIIFVSSSWNARLVQGDFCFVSFFYCLRHDFLI